MNRLNKHEDHAASKKERHRNLQTWDEWYGSRWWDDAGCWLCWFDVETSSGRRGWHSFRSSPLMWLVGSRWWGFGARHVAPYWVPVTIVTIVIQCMPPGRLATFLPLEQKRDTLRHRGDAWVLLRFGRCKCRKQGGIWFFVFISFFPRAFEQRVLLKVEVCYTSSHVDIFFSSSHLHIFSSSHLLIFSSSHLQVFTSSHPIFTHLLSLSPSSHLHIFTSSHLHIFTSSHLLSFFFLLSLSLSLAPSLSLSRPLSRSLFFFFFPLLRPQAVPTRRHNMATFSHEMRFECQKLSFFFASLVGPAATLSHEMRFECRSRCVWKGLCVRVFVCKRIVCKSVCV